MNMFLLLFLLDSLSDSRMALRYFPQDSSSGKRDGIAVLVEEVARSGRVLSIARTLDNRVRIAPGAPPVLAFRYLDGRQRGRFGGLDLVLDDAGH